MQLTQILVPFISRQTGGSMNKLLARIKYIFKSEKKRTQQMDIGYIEENNIKLFKYSDKNGNFDYKRYKNIQIAANRKKIDKSSIEEKDIEILSDWLIKNVSPLSNGLCHGTRRGLEQEFFHKYTGAHVLGTDISPTAKEFPNTIQHDFHDIKEEWVDFFDFIFSNSYDHSYNLEQCISQWVKCVRHGGVCVLEHSDGHRKMKETDPLGIERDTLLELLRYWGGKNNFYIEKTLYIQFNREKITTADFRFDNLYYIILRKK